MKITFKNIIEDYLKTHDRITTSEAFALFKQHQPEIKKSTVNWRLYELVQRGVIRRAGRGLYVPGHKDDYQPFISDEVKELSQLIRSAFPLITYSIWNTDQIKGFSQHIPAVSYTIVDVEFEGVFAVIDKLKENHNHVYNGNSKSVLTEILPDLKQAIVVKTLVSEAPILQIDNIPSPSLEKILVDLFCDSGLFDYLHGHELVHIYRNILNQYTVNITRLFRYAARRGKQNEIKLFMNQIIGNK